MLGGIYIRGRHPGPGISVSPATILITHSIPHHDYPGVSSVTHSLTHTISLFFVKGVSLLATRSLRACCTTYHLLSHITESGRTNMVFLPFSSNSNSLIHNLYFTLTLTLVNLTTTVHTSTLTHSLYISLSTLVFISFLISSKFSR